MAQDGSAVRIGAFVAGGLAILAGAVLLLGSGAFSSGGVERVVVFRESLQGLQVGAPITYNGVPVGSVSRIGGSVNVDDAEIVTGVGLAIEGGVLEADSPGLDTAEVLTALVDRGLRAQLATQSIVTGALYVRLVFAEGSETYAAPARFLDAPTIPGIPSDRERLGRFAESLGQDLPETLERVGAAADGVATLFDDRNRENIARTLDNLAAFSDSLAAAGPEVERAVATGARAMDRLDGAAAAFDGAASELASLVAANRETAATAIDEAAQAAESFATLADELETLARENRAAIRQFTSEALPQYRTLGVEATAMVRRIEALARRLEEEGAGFLLGGEGLREYQPRTR